MDWNGFWNWFGKLDNVLGVVTVIAATYTAWRLRRQAKQIKEMIKGLPPAKNFQDLIQINEGVKSSSPVAFAVCLSDALPSIKTNVRAFLDHKDWKNVPIEELNMDGINGKKGLEDFTNLLRQKKMEFQAAGYTEVHLFINGPVQAGTLIGAAFDNWIPVKLYHKTKSPSPEMYEYWMPLI